MHPLRRPTSYRGHVGDGLGDDYLRVTAALVLGFYLPFAGTAPDFVQHWAEALHTWLTLALAPFALTRLAIGAWRAGADHACRRRRPLTG